MQLRVATFNVHHGAGTDGVLDLQRTASVIAETDADLVALQELDRGMKRSGRVDQPAELGRLLGFEVVFFPTLSRGGGEYGIGFASRSPLAEARFVPLPQLGSEEPRGAVTAAFSGVSVVCTHLSTQTRPRSVQVAAVSAIARGLERPVVVMGDFNQDRAALRELLGLGFRGTFGHATLTRRLPRRRQLDHILISPDGAIERAWTLRTAASDHVPLVADLDFGAAPGPR